MPNFKLTNKPLTNLIVKSEEGLRIHPIQKVKKIHTGIDFEAAMDTSVKATHSGTIIKAGTAGGIGRVIVIKDQNSEMLTLYGHLNSFANGIGFGSEVVGGQEIGKSGDGSPYIKGLGPHLHFEIIDGEQIYTTTQQSVINLISNSGRIESGSLGMFSSKLNPIINPRPYLADLAIDIAKSEMTGDKSYLVTKADSDLTDSEKAEIYLASCDIFNCDLETKSQPEAIELSGDKRNNKIYTNLHDNKLSGSLGSDTYILSDLLSGGYDTIDDQDHDGTLSLGGVVVNDITVNCITDEAGEIIPNSWGFLHNGINYYMTRVNDRNDLDGAGKHLIITPLSASDNRNSVRINNFDFENGGFGINFPKAGDPKVTDLSTSTSDIRATHIILLKDDRFLIRWYGDCGDGVYGVCIQLFEKNGQMVGDKIVISDNSRTGVVAIPNGGFKISWESVPILAPDGRYIGSNSYEQQFDNDGHAAGDRYIISPEQVELNQVAVRSGTQLNTLTSNLTNGNFIRVYNNNGIGFQGSHVVLAQIHDSSGALVSDTFQVSNTTHNLHVNIGYPINDPVDNSYLTGVYPLPNGKVLISYNSAPYDEFNYSYEYCIILNSDGSKFTDEFPMSKDQIYVDQYYYPPQVIVFPDSQFVASWGAGYNVLPHIQINFQIFDQMGRPKINQCLVTDKAAIPKINKIAEIIDLESDTQMASSELGSNIFSLASGESTTYQISNFKPNGGDQIDFSILNDAEDYDGIDPAENTEVALTYKQQGADTIISAGDYGIKIILQNFDAAGLSLASFAGNITLQQNQTLPSQSSFEVTNLHQNLQYNQTDSAIDLQNMVLTPINPADEFEINITLKDKSGRIINNADELLIPVGETEDGSKSSNFSKGVWRATGNATEVNDLLENLQIDLGENFAEDFELDISIKDLTNNITKTNSSAVDYNCVELPLELTEIIDSQKTIAGKNLIMNLIRYFKDPKDPQYEKAIFNLSADINDAMAKNSPDIKRINSSSFEIGSNQTGVFEMTAAMQSRCDQIINQTFSLNISEPDSNLTKTSSSNSGNHTALIIGLLSGGGVLLLTAGLCALYKNSDKVKSFCSKLLDKTAVNDDNKELKQQDEEAQFKPNSVTELTSGRKLDESVQEVNVYYT